MEDVFFESLIKHVPVENLILEVLRDAHANEYPVEICCAGRQTVKHVSGFVERIYDDTIVIGQLGNDGESDGTTILRINRIRKVARQTRALCRALFLREQDICGAFTYHEVNPEPKVDGIYAELEYALATSTPVECELDERSYSSDVSGLVQRLNDEYCEMLQLCYDGDPDGVATFRWRDVCTIERDTPDLQRIMALYHARHQVYGNTDPQA